MKRCLFFCIVLFYQSNVFSQDLTGTWESESTGFYAKIVLIHIGDSLFGYTYDREMGYCKNNFLGAYNKQTKELKGKDISVIEHTFFHMPSRYKLQYQDGTDNEFLTGNAFAKGVLMTALSFGMPMRVKYKRTKSQPDSITDFMVIHVRFNETVNAGVATSLSEPKNDTVFLLSPKTAKDSSVSEITEVKKRKDVLVKTIDANETVKLTLYDNGQIDGDTVTLFHNDSIMLHKYCLTAKPKIIEFIVNQNMPQQTITMMANNLGTIPPNTAMLVIETNGKRYEVVLSSDFSTNAVVKFIYKQ